MNKIIIAILFILLCLILEGAYCYGKAVIAGSCDKYNMFVLHNTTYICEKSLKK